MIPDGWKSITIGDLTSSHSYGPRFHAKNYDENGNVKTIRNTDVTAEGEILYTQAPIASLEPEIIEQHALKTGDLIVITTADCGLSAIFKEQDIPYIPSAYAVRYRLNQNVLPLFIKYFMHTKLAQKQVAQFVRKGTVANLPGSDVLKIKLVLPPLSEQKKIAEILGSVDEAIASTQAVIDQTRKVKQGLLQQLLTKGIGHTKFKESAIGKIPESWEVVPFDSLALIGPQNGIYKSKDDYGSGVPMIDMGAIFGSDIIEEVERRCVRLTEDEYEKFALKEGDLLFARRSLVAEGSGKCSILGYHNIEPVFESSIIRFRLKPNLGNPLFYFYYWESPLGKKQRLEITRQVAVSGITGKDLSKLLVPLPPINEQIRISKILKNIDKQIDSNDLTINQLNLLKRGLMQDLLTGKVRVK
ncbi:restriction endonuclease subunit S [Planktothrix sp. FACHB-1355]|uniref:Restriction endonuclease subunit S n=1 Tax=Aerosakkonema funiforme FACHB-1375 TaxID=2949571 RepID=A0A926VDM6_9CYAN|nr:MULTISPECIES: restriction endonuclease subunit S [Oscillatoriales]MBD2181871.1 restriction endonuclease subunit S [Aerosakkonema funiforme FACHB-1375]MBD3557291.1 restriction endonuclease subunit S [Planktothrix sp. FACHB-1355]